MSTPKTMKSSTSRTEDHRSCQCMLEKCSHLNLAFAVSGECKTFIQKLNLVVKYILNLIKCLYTTHHHLGWFHFQFSSNFSLHPLIKIQLCFLSGFSFTNIHDSQTGQQGEGGGIYLFSTTFTRFTDTLTLARLLLQRAHLYTQLAAGLEPGTFDFQAHIANHV